MRAKIQLYENILEIGVYYLHCALRNLDILSEMSWNGKCLSHVELPKQLLLLIYLFQKFANGSSSFWKYHFPEVTYGYRLLFT